MSATASLSQQTASSPAGPRTPTAKGDATTPTAEAVNKDPVVVLPFPPQIATDPTSFLKPFKDENSTFPSIAKACLQLCQFAGTGSSALSPENMDHSTLFHDNSYVKIIQSTCAALIECLQQQQQQQQQQQHSDRRCRILACQTLAITARCAYARIRPSPLLFSMREPNTVTRLEDEMATDIPAALCNVAMQDSDDGVAAAALEALGQLVISSCPTVGGTLVDDELIRELQAMAFGKHSPYTPTLRSVTDEDPLVALQELQTRILDNCMSPRFLQLVDRTIRFRQTHYTASALPVLTACCIHIIQASAAKLYDMDRATYSKRWTELDALGLADILVHSIILPAMQHSSSGALAHCAALQGLRLANVCTSSTNHMNCLWVHEVAQWAVIVFKEEVLANAATMSIEDRLTTLAAMIVGLRAIPLHTRTPTLIWMANEILVLPSTTSAPAGILSAGLLTNWSGVSVFRRPARIGLWTEIALSFFIDGTCEETSSSSTTTTATQPQPHQRSDYLKQFLSSPILKQTFAEIDMSGNILTAKDELLFAFTSVAVQTGRRFLVAADGSAQIADPTTPQVQDWLKMVWVVLTSFVSSVHMGPHSPYLEEDLSLVTACLASYVQLLQEYLHFVGLLNPSSSVALKLGANACPPHILWDRMTESADFLSKFESMDLGALESSTKLMDELVSRELKQGIPSHHMRLFILSLASDHWVQGRIVCCNSNKTDTASFNTESAREILLALSPKRLLSKISKSHVPPVDNDGKPKRDPIKKLALECVRVSAACIENMALVACEWRRRFGQSQETKHIVNVAVGLLQGKIDDTPMDELMKSVMGPTCNAVVGRIQQSFEGGGGGNNDDEFPQSELVSQQVKIKIKPLVSTTRPNPRNSNDVMRDYLTQLCRQIVTARVLQCVQSCPPADTLQTAARPANCFRLKVPPLPESQDGRLYGHRSDALAAWDKSVIACSAGSDPAQVLLAYTIRRMLRYDGEEEYRLCVLMRASNMTAVELEHGLRLELGLIQNQLESEDMNDPISAQLSQSLHVSLEDILTDIPSWSSSIVFKDEIRPAEFVTWEIALEDLPHAASTRLLPAVVFRNVAVEPDDVGVKMVGEAKTAKEASKAEEDNSGEDDFQVTTTADSGGSGLNSETDDVRMPLEPLTISPMVRFQPCPLVFFTDRCGDADSFRLLWFRLPHHLSPLKIMDSPYGYGETENSSPAHDQVARKIATMSELVWEGEAIPGGTATRLWAFMTLTGHRVYCVLTEMDKTGQQILHFRAENKQSLYCIAGSKASREAIVEAMVPGMIPEG